VIELLVVIIGVFIGIQVSNWNEARLERTRAHSYLERIGADLDADILNYEDRLGFWEDVLEYGAAGLDFAETGARDNRTDWELLLAYFQASQLAEFYTTQTTYDELKSGGELGLIRDLNLRNQLARYYTNANNPVLTERPRYREHVRGLIPLGVQDYIWISCYSSDGETRQELLECDGPIEVENAGQIVQRISGDVQLMSELRCTADVRATLLDVHHARRPAHRERKAQLREALAGHCRKAGRGQIGRPRLRLGRNRYLSSLKVRSGH